MRLQRRSNGQVITLDPKVLVRLGKGGEAHVYSLSPISDLAIKIYDRPADTPVRKLVAMIDNPPDDPMVQQGHTSIAWPIDLLQTSDSKRNVLHTC